MSNNKFIHHKIEKLMSECTKIRNVYEDIELVKYYNDISNQANDSSDISYYLSKLDKDNFIVELASGSGRVLKKLIDEGFNVHGIEYMQEMIRVMPTQYEKYVTQSDILDFKRLSLIYKHVDSLILPATSITLFSLDTFDNFLKNIITLNKDFNIILDFYEINDLITENPQKNITEEGPFYDINFKANDKFIYNIYHKNLDILGISIKYDHSLHNIVDIMKKNGMQVETVCLNNNYYMIEGKYNEK